MNDKIPDGGPLNVGDVVERADGDSWLVVGRESADEGVLPEVAYSLEALGDGEVSPGETEYLSVSEVVPADATVRRC